MAPLAGNFLMGAVKLEPGLRVVIEKRGFPILRRMAAATIGRALAPRFRVGDGSKLAAMGVGMAVGADRFGADKGQLSTK